jgi:hypothetical protein
VQATRRLRRWFFAVDGAALDGQGYALTLTVRHLPPTAADWTRTREAFLDRMRRAGMVRGQWLTEWQRRGVPHLHGAVYFADDGVDRTEAVAQHWLDAAADWRPGRDGQHVADIWGIPGWLQYQAKHSSRGVWHYQRATVPAAWKSGTGRLWGAVGEWPARELPLEVDMAVFWRFRRLMRAWLIAHARRAGEQRRVVYLRRMLADPERARSAVRAVGEFCPEHVALALLHCSITAEADEAGPRGA